MTPEARIGAAIDILDRVLGGLAAEPALTGWARSHRFAGARDRAAIRDLVFDALRRGRSCLARSGAAAETGRALMIGHVAASGGDPAAVFTGAGYGPPPPDADERAGLAAAAGAAVPELVALDFPDWSVPALPRARVRGFAPVL